MQQVTNVLTGDPLWSALQIRNGPILRPANQQRIVWCGWPGAGKSTILLSVPRCLILDTERGSEELPTVHPSTYRRTITRWEDWLETAKVLKEDSEKNGSRRRFDMVAFDTFDSFGGGSTSILAEYIMRDSNADVIAAFGANGSGWNRLAELASRALLEVESWGYGWICTVHIRRKLIQLETGTTSRVVRDLTANIERIVSNRASYIGVLQKAYEQVPKKVKVNLPGRGMVETETGEYTSIPKYSVTFTSTPTGIEEMCKARLLQGVSYEWTPETGWSEFASRYDAAREAIESAAQSGGKVISNAA